MKLRVRGDSLRLRLTQGEVARIAQGLAVEEHTHFGAGAPWVVRLEPAEQQLPSAGVDAGGIVVRWPQAEAVRWASSADVGLRGEHSVEPGRALRLLVEKDFACLAPREGDNDVDTFPHPGKRR